MQSTSWLAETLIPGLTWKHMKGLCWTCVKCFTRPWVKCSKISRSFLIDKIWILHTTAEGTCAMSSCYECTMLQPGLPYLCSCGHAVSTLPSVIIILVATPHGDELYYWSGCYIHWNKDLLWCSSGNKLLRLKPLSSKDFLQSLNHSWDKNLVKLQTPELPWPWPQGWDIYVKKILSLVPLYYSAVLLFKAS